MTVVQQIDVRAPARQTRVVAARLHGGPYDGAEEWIFRVRTDYLRRVRRSRLARLLNRPPRYAWYQLAPHEDLDTSNHAVDYVFRAIRPAAVESARRYAWESARPARLSRLPRWARRR